MWAWGSIYYPTPLHWLAGSLAGKIHKAGIAADVKFLYACLSASTHVEMDAEMDTEMFGLDRSWCPSSSHFFLDVYTDVHVLKPLPDR